MGVTYNLAEDPTPPTYDVAVVVAALRTANGPVETAAAATVAVDDAREVRVEVCVQRKQQGAKLGMTLVEVRLAAGGGAGRAGKEEEEG